MVPPVTGLSQDDALAELRAAGLTVEVIQESGRAVPLGRVSHQYPAAGDLATSGSRAGIIVSTGPEPETSVRTHLPDVVGMREDDAVWAVTSAGLRPTVLRDHSDTVPEGVVVAQEPNAASLAPAAMAREVRRWLWVLVAVLALAGVAVAGYLLTRTDDVAVPEVRGLTVPAAQTRLENAGLELGSVTRNPDADAPADTIIAQDPRAGEPVPEGSTVDVVVAGADADVEVPSVTGNTAARAQSILEEAGLAWRVTEAYDDEVDRGRVVAQSPQAGTRVEEGAEIALTVSQGPEPPPNVDVPDVTGMTEARAQRALEQEDLRSTSLRNHSETVANGNVVNQAPAAGSSVAPGTQVLLIVSRGAAPEDVVMVAIPDVVGMTGAEAEAALRGAGFEVETVELPDAEVDEGLVTGQFPSAGEELPEGSTVAILVSAGAAEGV
jgi:serine/threonine-protein kinase